MLRQVIWSIPAVAVLMVASHLQAGCACGDAVVECGCAAPPVRMVEKKVMVPTWTTEKRTVTVCKFRKEQRQRTYTVKKLVPVTKEVVKECTVMVPEVRTKLVNYTVCKPVCRTVEKQYTVMVPHKEVRHGKRTVCKPVRYKQTRTVCEDRGCWQTRKECVCVVDRCGCPQTKTICKKVWVPNIVKREIEVTCCKMQRVQEDYEYCVTVCKPETRTCTVKQVDYVREKRTRECKYTVCVPQKRTRVCKVTTCKCVTEERTCNYTVCIPVKVQKEICVKVCKMVCKTIQVPCPEPCCRSRSCGRRVHRRRTCCG